MGIFRRNAGKIALVALIVFFSLPFIYGNEEENEFSPFAVKSGLSYQANPISKLANRIASFYGLPKSNLTTTSERINMDKGENIRGKVSGAFIKQNAESKNVADTKQNQSEQILSKKLNSFETDQTIIVPSKSLYENATTATSVTYNSYNRASNTPAVEYVQIDGSSYKVVQDITGKKYVATAKGHVPYEQVMRNTVSEREFLAAKKRLVNASDAEVVQYVLDQKKVSDKTPTANTNNANTANYAAANYNQNNYRDSYAQPGSATAMGGKAVKADTSFKTDTGFDDSLLSNVYAEIKNIKVQKDTQSQSSSSSSSSRNSSYGEGNKNTSSIITDPKEIEKWLSNINKEKDKEEKIDNVVKNDKNEEKQNGEGGSIEPTIPEGGVDNTRFTKDFEELLKKGEIGYDVNGHLFVVDQNNEKAKKLVKQLLEQGKNINQTGTKDVKEVMSVEEKVSPSNAKEIFYNATGTATTRVKQIYDKKFRQPINDVRNMVNNNTPDDNLEKVKQ